MNLKTILLMWLLTSSLTYSQKLEKAHKKVDSLFQKQLRQKNVHNAFLTVHSNRLGIDWNYAQGNFKDGTPVSENNPFLSTSIAKTYTATLVMILQEEGKLDVDDSLAEYLPSDIIEGLHIYKDVDYSQQIRIKQLLNHTSGLPDYFEDAPNEGPAFMELLFSDPEKMWNPLETIDFAKSKLTPHFLPGKGYHYSDTEYVLLGLLIEELTGKPLHEVLSEKLFRPLNMQNTYMHLRSQPLDESTGKLAELYVDDAEISSFKSLSADWAGGGLATTAQDLLKFHKALNEEKLVSKKSLRQMQKWVKESFGLEYGYGLRKFQLKKLNPLLGRLTLIGHSGTSGAFMYYCPEMDVYLTGTFNQTAYQKKHVVFMMQVLAQLKSLKKGKDNEEG
ncbi:serine hydrolase domain-containing protein [Maribacter chungangensis]|uniref:Serine hydrolase domain-containing protein n=1 Tax=Maribacter chungangensis TaxID=1069117 RepID=A0ABW3AZA6_9FLAO